MRKAIGIASFVALVGSVLFVPAALAAPPDDKPEYRVYVFTRGAPTSLSTAAVKAVKDLGKANGFTVQSNGDPTSFTEENLAPLPRGGPPRGLGRRPQRGPAGRLRGLLHQRRRRAGDPQRDRDRARLGLPDRGPRRTLERPHRPARRARSRSRTASTRRPASCPSTGTEPSPGTTSTSTSAASATSSQRSPRTRSTPSRRAWSPGSRAARWASTTRSRGARTSTAVARSTPVSAARRRRSRTPCTASICLGRSAGRPASPTRSTPTAELRSSQTSSRPS